MYRMMYAEGFCHWFNQVISVTSICDNFVPSRCIRTIKTFAFLGNYNCKLALQMKISMFDISMFPLIFITAICFTQVFGVVVVALQCQWVARWFLSFSFFLFLSFFFFFFFFFCHFLGVPYAALFLQPKLYIYRPQLDSRSRRWKVLAGI